MLNVWKRTWKENDSQSRLDEPGNTASSLDVAGAVHPSDTISSFHKRIRTGEGEDVLQPLAKDQSPLQPHLEDLDSTLEEQVLQQVKLKNTIALVPPLRSTLNLLVRSLEWAIGIERGRPHIAIKRHRSAFLVVDDLSSLELYGAGIKRKNPMLWVGIYNRISHSELESWAKILKHDVVILPPTLLLDSLIRGTLAITQIHTLIFCDAQTVMEQGSHPVVQVMNNFYCITDTLSRPRILALAAFPADTCFHIDSAMLNLENILDSKILGITPEKRAEILAVADEPRQVVLLYNETITSTPPALLSRLLEHDPSESLYPEYYKTSREAFVQLGSCASDLVWRRAQTAVDKDPWCQDDGRSEVKVAAIRDIIKNWPFAMPNLDSSSRGFNVTHKFLQLVRILEACEPYGESFRAVVFVREGAIAQIIVDLLRTLSQLCWLRPCALLTSNALDSHYHHRKMMYGFTIGTYNLLIAAVRKEDSHVLKAPVVVCFDAFESQILQSFIHACTSGRESHVIHMVQEGEDGHRRLLSNNFITNKVLTSTNYVHLQLPSSSANASKNKGTKDEIGHHLAFIQDPTTGRRIHPQCSMDVISLLETDILPKYEDTAGGQALFEFNELLSNGPASPRSYTCVVSLHGFRRITGPCSASKELAKQAACYKVCQELFSAGLLDYRLFPQDKAAFDDDDALNDSGAQQTGTRSYPHKEPDFWANVGSAAVTSLFPTVISPRHTVVEHGTYSPLAILTRHPLPELRSTKLFDATIPVMVVFERAAPLQVDESRLQDLYRYTLRMSRTICNKPYGCDMEDTLYFLVPLRKTWTSRNNTGFRDPFYFPSIAGYIPWDLVNLASRDYAVPLTITPRDQEMQNVVVQDRWAEFTRRYKVVRIRSDLTPLSKPADSPREANYDSFLDFCKARVKGFTGLQDLKQPLIEVSTVPSVTNLLNPTSRPIVVPHKNHAKYLIPELCAKFTMPASTLLTARLIPSVTRRINDLLLVKELNAKLFNHTISETLLHMALCTPSSGVEYDYERLELLGDAFLKYLSTIYVFLTNPTCSEGSLHLERQKLISNKSLYQNARRKGLPSYIQSKPFAPKSWHPPNFTLLVAEKVVARKSSISGQDEDDQAESMVVVSSPLQPDLVDATSKPSTQKEKDNTRKKKKRRSGEDVQWLGDKAIADVAEAIIGAAYLTGGCDTALKVTKALGVAVLNVDQWSDFGPKGIAPVFKTTTKIDTNSIQAIEGIIRHRILRPDLLAQALTHSSVPSTGSISYERLEFIGDAILDFMVTRHLFTREKELNPGGLTLLKGAMVSNSTLAAACVLSGLHEHLLYESNVLRTTIQQYISKIHAYQKKEHDAAEREGRSPGQYWLGLEAPKTLSDVMESVIGAIYISDDFSPVGSEALFENLLKPFYDKHVTLKTLSHHPTKNLFELLQARGCQRFKMLKERSVTGITSCLVLVHDVILTSAEDSKAVGAARRASLIALDALEGDPGFLTRTCDCRSKSKPTKRERDDAKLILKFEEEQDMLAVEDELMEMKEAQEEESELEDGMILE